VTKVVIVALLGALAVGCAPEPKTPWNPTAPLITPSGKEGWAIWCTEESDCYQWAGYRCQSGYTIVSSDTRTNRTTSFEWNRFGGGGGSTERKKQSMVVECKTYEPPVVHNPPLVIFHEDENGNVIE
jgi:hypothetical protein